MAKTEEVVLDFTQVRPFEPMNPDRVYLAQIVNLELGTSKASGQPKARCELQILAPEEVEVVDLEGRVQTDDDGNPRYTRAKGRRLFREFSLQSQALAFLYEFIKAVDPALELGDAFTFRPSDYIGMEVAVKIRNEEFEEQIRPRVTRFLPASAYRE